MNKIFRALSLIIGLSFFWIGIAPAFGDLPASERISAEELHAKQTAQKNLLLLDARDRRSFEQGHIAGARLPLSDEFYDQQELYGKQMIPSAPDRDAALAAAMEHTPKTKAIVTYCNTDCQASVHLLLSLKSLGFSNVKAMEDGFQVWETKGYPVERKKIAFV